MAVNFLVGLLLLTVIVKIMMWITAMKPYNGSECLVGKVALVVGGSKGLFLLLLFSKILKIVYFYD